MSFQITNVSNATLITLDETELWAASYKWHLTTHGPYTTFPGYPKVFLSYLVLSRLRNPRVCIPAPPAIHLNGNLYDCQLGNLATWEYNPEQAKRKQAGTRSGYRGVSWDSQRSKWCAQLSIFGQRVHRSHHDLELDAAVAYDSAVLASIGPDSPRLNRVTIVTP